MHTRRIHWGLILTATLLCFVMPSRTWASGNGTTSTYWHIQNTGFAANEASAVAMRDGGAWPVIFEGRGNVYSLFSTEGPNPGSNWHQIGSGLYYGSFTLQVATSKQGHIAVLGLGTSSPAGVVRNPDGNWSSLPAWTTDIAFDSEGNLLTINDYESATGFNPPEGITSIGRMAVSPFDDIWLLAGGGQFYEYNHLLNAWHTQTIGDIFANDIQLMDMAYDSLGRPFLLTQDPNDTTIRCVYYDIRSASWITEVVMYSPNRYFTDSLVLAANDSGVIGTAFVSNNNLYYAYKDNNEDWATDLVDTGVDEVRQVGITYDYEGLPLISYSKNDTLHLAYDPIITITPGLPGDLDGDGFVGLNDLDILLTHWNQNVAIGSEADPSLDGFVGLDDLDLVLENWNTGTPPANTVIPEPSTLALLALGVLAAARRHKLRHA